MRRSLLPAVLLLVASLTATGCGPSSSSLANLASRGKIDRSAPVSTHLQVVIDAPPATVWHLLVDAPAWPSWQKQVTDVNPAQALAPHSRFDWKTGGTTVHSQVRLWEPEQRLVWTGNVLTLKAINSWRLSQQGSQTLVTTDESMDGPLITFLFPSSKLAQADQAWLTSLKQAAEAAR